MEIFIIIVIILQNTRRVDRAFGQDAAVQAGQGLQPDRGFQVPTRGVPLWEGQQKCGTKKVEVCPKDNSCSSALVVDATPS